MRIGILCMAIALAGGVLAAELDEVEGPWGTAHGTIEGVSSTEAIPYTWGTGPVEEAWSLDIRAEGHDRVGGRNPITFDAAGNIYWKSSVGGGTGGLARILSVKPDGTIRWFGNDNAGGLHSLGNFLDSTAAVVGKNAVYALGAHQDTGQLFAVAYNKETGAVLWETDLDDAVAGPAVAPPAYTAADLLTPVLYKGKLYIVAPDVSTSLPQNVYRVDAATGGLDWYDHLDGVAIKMNGSVTFVENAFAAGEHGLYCNGDSGSGADGIFDVYAFKVLTNGAELAWSAEGGKVARSHLVYSSETKLLYAHTWSDYGGTFYVYNPVDGFVTSMNNEKNSGHGFYDVGCLDFSGLDIIAGGFEGLVIRYTDDGAGAVTSTIAYDGAVDDSAWFGEYRVYGQLLRDTEGNSILIAGTNSNTDADPLRIARVVGIDVTDGTLLWSIETGVIQNHGYTIRGGPYMGPDGKVYYFKGDTGDLVALKGPSGPPPTLFKRGDANADGSLNIADAVFVLSRLFAGGPAPTCEDTADGNNDGAINIADAVKILGHLFGGEGPLPDPFAACGLDTGEEDTLTCVEFAPCKGP